MGLRNIVEEQKEIESSISNTDEDDKEQVDRNTVRHLLGEHTGLLNLQLSSLACARVIETTRWVLAFDDRADLTERRKEAQDRVSERDDVELQTVQQAVRDMYDGQYGRKSAQQLFDEDLEDVESAYKTKMKHR